MLARALTSSAPVGPRCRSCHHDLAKHLLQHALSALQRGFCTARASTDGHKSSVNGSCTVSPPGIGVWSVSRPELLDFARPNRDPLHDFFQQLAVIVQRLGTTSRWRAG